MSPTYLGSKFEGILGVKPLSCCVQSGINIELGGAKIRYNFACQ